MQTFLPYDNFVQTAKVLDYRRLGKQRVEARQIYNSLTTGKGWIHHPATRMWKNHTDALIIYHNAMIKEWITRGYNNSMLLLPENLNWKKPKWLGDQLFHDSHKAALLKKNPGHYSKFNWNPSMEWYYWPYYDDENLCESYRLWNSYESRWL